MRHMLTGGCLLALLALFMPEGIRAEMPGDWPQWRGPQRDGVSQERGLLKQWPDGGPAVVWRVDSVGIGYSSLAIQDGRIITQGDLDGIEHIIALSVEDGSLLWAVQPAPVAAALAGLVESQVQRMDRNADGVIDEAEALLLLGPRYYAFDRKTEQDPEQLAQQRTERLLDSLDGDGDGQLSFAEAGARLREAYDQIDSADASADKETLARRRTTTLFDEFDANDDGKLSLQEARTSFAAQPFRGMDARDQATNRGDDQLTPEEVQQYLLLRSAGRDGVLSSQELSAYYQQRCAGQDGILTKAELGSYYGGLRDGQGNGPRGTPTIDAARVYVEGGTGNVTCLDAATGKTIWHVSLIDDLGGSRPGWGYSESPLVEGDLLIVTPGGNNGTVVALNKHDGKLVWRSESVTEGAQYSSPIAADLAGRRQIVQFARESVFGISAENGQLLWNYQRANNRTANVCTPIVHQDHVFASSGYGTGGGLVRISSSPAGCRADEVYFEKSMANHHGGIVLLGDTMYGFGSAGLMAMNYLSGEIAWRARSVTKGSLVAADGMLYCLGERHEMALVEATPEAYREHGRFKIDNLGPYSWAHPVVAGGRLYIRNQQTLTAYDVRADKQ